MKPPEDIVWDTITESAKKRFDYLSFRGTFADMHNDNVADNVLFMTIAGHAAGDSTDQIAADINQQFLLIGCSLEGDFKQFVVDRRSDLFREIEAAKQALAFFDMGSQTPGILVQVRSILNRP
jgi:hypothetical protein